MKRKYKNVLSIILLGYGFLCMANWGFNPQDWNGFSRVVLGGIGVYALIELLDL